ncbi:hypothetical protein Nepgr_018840 [Nepenthes gracilis]|uniref:Uncharacterized protein n=1 Tax=Nepenthes gracilis TaxID=150966 RepID=A0AAD3SUK4_NEPGR|nr:hypothetical protein Nepgr_018840 [Nepenthes gracilis]
MVGTLGVLSILPPPLPPPSQPIGHHPSPPSLSPLVGLLFASSQSPPFSLPTLPSVPSFDHFSPLLRDGMVHVPAPDTSFLKASSGSVPRPPEAFSAYLVCEDTGR